jgi:hypothetical protein
MITGTHLLFYSENPEADRAFFRDVLKFHAVDAGHGWLIFSLPPAEAGIHPVEDAVKQPGQGPLLDAVVYLMCDDLETQIKELETRKVSCSPVEKAPWGMKTTLRLPSGRQLGLYEPRHPTALHLK